MPENGTPEIKRDEDFELVQAINAGQSERFAELVGRYEKKLYNFGLRMCGNVEDAEDMVQDTFLNVFKYLGSFRYETKLRNWIYRIATSACIKRRRKSKFAPDRELSLDEFLPGDGEGMPREIPDWANVPLDRLLDEELSKTVKSGIDSLPEKYRMILLLRDIEGFSTTEAAQILDLTESNVKVRLHRARLYLRERLKGYFENERPSSP
jgi:RNA polymerase sigma-70 factor (ECF subfamily)